MISTYMRHYYCKVRYDCYFFMSNEIWLHNISIWHETWFLKSILINLIMYVHMRHDYRKVRNDYCLQDIIAISLFQMRYDYW